jgi:hypothetical protein
LVQIETRAPEVIVGDQAVNNKRTDGLSGAVPGIDGRTELKANCGKAEIAEPGIYQPVPTMPPGPPHSPQFAFPRQAVGMPVSFELLRLGTQTLSSEL